MTESPHSYIAVTCAVCGTRLHASEEQIGQSLRCHDCGRSTIVRAPRPKTPVRPILSDEDDAPLALGAMPERIGYEPFTAVGHRAGQLAEEDESGDRDPRRDEPVPGGPVALFQGVWSTPWQRECWRQWLVFSVWLLLLSLLALLAIRMFLVPAMGFLSVGPWILAAGMMVATLVFGALGAVFFSVRLVAIVVDTAAGSRRIVNWPDALFLDSVPDSLFVLMAAAVAAIPASVFAWMIDPPPLGWGATSVVFLVSFPVVHLSMLERGSKLAPLSPLVLASLGKVGWAWLITYAQSGALLAATVGLIAGGYWLAGWWIVVPAAALVPAALMIYFRLLGRLAWCCTVVLNEGERATATATDGSADGSPGIMAR